MLQVWFHQFQSWLLCGVSLIKQNKGFSFPLGCRTPLHNAVKLLLQLTVIRGNSISMGCQHWRKINSKNLKMTEMPLPTLLQFMGIYVQHSGSLDNSRCFSSKGQLKANYTEELLLRQWWENTGSIFILKGIWISSWPFFQMVRKSPEGDPQNSSLGLNFYLAEYCLQRWNRQQSMRSTLKVLYLGSVVTKDNVNWLSYWWA